VGQEFYFQVCTCTCVCVCVCGRERARESDKERKRESKKGLHKRIRVQVRVCMYVCMYVRTDVSMDYVFLVSISCYDVLCIYNSDLCKYVCVSFMHEIWLVAKRCTWVVLY